MWWSRKDIPVIASPKAAKIVQRLGFTDVRSVAHGTSTEIPGLQAWATVGGRVGPPWAVRENGFVLQELQTGLRWGLYCRCNVDTHNICQEMLFVKKQGPWVCAWMPSVVNLWGFDPHTTPHAAYLWIQSLLPSTKIQLKLCIPMKSFVLYPDHLNCNPCALEPWRGYFRVLWLLLYSYILLLKRCVYLYIFTCRIFGNFRNPHAGLTLVMVYLVVQDLLWTSLQLW